LKLVNLFAIHSLSYIDNLTIISSTAQTPVQIPSDNA